MAQPDSHLIRTYIKFQLVIHPAGNSVKVTFGGESSTRAPSFAAAPQKHRLRLSNSMPTLSKTWRAFEIDPDQDDTLTLEVCVLFVDGKPQLMCCVVLKK